MLLAACSATTKRQWLTFFFDDVPSAERSVTEAATNAALIAAQSPSIHAELEKQAVLHSPYADRQCTACHESKFSQKLRGPVATVCLSCHEDLFDGVVFRHAPAESGYCQGCHDPHQSPERFLLVRTGQPLCRYCHDESDVAMVVPHASIGKAACQSCHEPHGSKNKHLLKPGAQREGVATSSSVSP